VGGRIEQLGQGKGGGHSRATGNGKSRDHAELKRGKTCVRGKNNGPTVFVKSRLEKRRLKALEPTGMKHGVELERRRGGGRAKPARRQKELKVIKG